MASKKNGVRRVLGTRTEQLPVQLTEPEKKELGARMARLEGELREHVRRTKEIAGDMKARKDALDGDLGRVGLVLRQGYELRAIPVRHEADFAAGLVTEVREDTGEVVRERALQPQERQGTLLDSDAAPEAQT